VGGGVEGGGVEELLGSGLEVDELRFVLVVVEVVGLVLLEEGVEVGGVGPQGDDDGGVTVGEGGVHRAHCGDGCVDGAHCAGPTAH